MVLTVDAEEALLQLEKGQAVFLDDKPDLNWVTQKLREIPTSTIMNLVDLGLGTVLHRVGHSVFTLNEDGWKLAEELKESVDLRLEFPPETSTVPTGEESFCSHPEMVDITTHDDRHRKLRCTSCLLLLTFPFPTVDH